MQLAELSALSTLLLRLNKAWFLPLLLTRSLFLPSALFFPFSPLFPHTYFPYYCSCALSYAFRIIIKLWFCLCVYVYAWDCICVHIHLLACVGMPTEITIYLSADHIRAEESSRGIREMVEKIMLAVITWAHSLFTVLQLLSPSQTSPLSVQLRKKEWFAVLRRIADSPAWF